MFIDSTGRSVWCLKWHLIFVMHLKQTPSHRSIRHVKGLIAAAQNSIESCTFITAVGWPWHIEASLWYTFHLPLAQCKAAWLGLGDFAIRTSDVSERKFPYPTKDIRDGWWASCRGRIPSLRKNQFSTKECQRFKSKWDKNSAKMLLDSMLELVSWNLNLQSTSIRCQVVAIVKQKALKRDGQQDRGPARGGAMSAAVFTELRSRRCPKRWSTCWRSDALWRGSWWHMASKDWKFEGVILWVSWGLSLMALRRAIPRITLQQDACICLH